MEHVDDDPSLAVFLDCRPNFGLKSQLSSAAKKKTKTELSFRPGQTCLH